jgi:hypothetical protein
MIALGKEVDPALEAKIEAARQSFFELQAPADKELRAKMHELWAELGKARAEKQATNKAKVPVSPELQSKIDLLREKIATARQEAMAKADPAEAERKVKIQGLRQKLIALRMDRMACKGKMPMATIEGPASEV